MSAPENHIEDKFRQKLENFSPPVPEAVWDAVAHAVPEEENRRGFWWFFKWPYGAIFLVLFLGGTGSWLWWSWNDAGIPELSYVDQAYPIKDSASASGNPDPASIAPQTSSAADKEKNQGISRSMDTSSLRITSSVNVNENATQNSTSMLGDKAFSTENSAQVFTASNGLTKSKASINVHLQLPENAAHSEASILLSNDNLSSKSDVKVGDQPNAPYSDPQEINALPTGAAWNLANPKNPIGETFGQEKLPLDTLPPVANPGLPLQAPKKGQQSTTSDSLQAGAPLTPIATDSVASNQPHTDQNSIPPETIEEPKLNQEKKDTNTRKHTYHLSVFGGPSRAYRSLISDQNRVLVEHKNEHEKEIFGYNVGFNVGIGYRHFSLSLGSHLTMKGEKYNYNSVVVSHNTVNKYYYLSVPITAGYAVPWLQSGNFTMRPTAAFDVNYLLKAQASWLDPFTHNAVIKDSKVNSNPYRTLAFSYELGLDLGYQVTPNLQIGLWPGYTRFIHSIYKSNELLQQRPYSFDTNLVLRYTW